MSGAVPGMTPMAGMVVVVGAGVVNGVLAMALMVGVNAGVGCR